MTTARAILISSIVLSFAGCPASTNNTLRFVNNSDFLVTGIWVAHESSPTWGENQLRTPLAQGQSFRLFIDFDDFYDIRVTRLTSDGMTTSAELYDIPLFGNAFLEVLIFNDDVVIPTNKTSAFTAST